MLFSLLDTDDTETTSLRGEDVLRVGPVSPEFGPSARPRLSGARRLRVGKPAIAGERRIQLERMAPVMFCPPRNESPIAVLPNGIAAVVSGWALALRVFSGV